MKHVLTLIMICGLLLGCVSGPAGSGTDNAVDGQGEITGAAGSAATKDSTEGAIAQAPENATGDAPPVQPQPEEKAYSATFSELACMKIPLECSINYTYSGRQVSARFYLGEDGELRVESPEGVSQCGKTITIIRNTRQYVGCSDKDIIIGCGWFKSAYDPATPGLASSFDFQNVPASSISCRDWEYDASMFTTSGTACELG